LVGRNALRKERFDDLVNDLMRRLVDLGLRVGVRTDVGDGVLNRGLGRGLVIDYHFVRSQVVHGHYLRQAFDALLLRADGQRFDVGGLDTDVGVYGCRFPGGRVGAAAGGERRDSEQDANDCPSQAERLTSELSARFAKTPRGRSSVLRGKGRGVKSQGAR
jgi:hypothetical protein